MAEEIDKMMRESPLMIRTLIRAHYRSVPKEALHLVGEPSTVKSTFAELESRRLAEEEGREWMNWNRATSEMKLEVLKAPERFHIFADIRASETDVGELRLQDMQNGKEYITYKYNLLFEVLSKPAATGILFLDELNNAPTLQKTQFYKVINDRAIGDIPIADGVLVMSAGNEVEHSYGSTEDPVPLVLRRANYFIRPPNADEFVDFGFQSGVHEWVLGYVAFQPSEVHRVVYDNPNPIGQPCSRTWVKFSNVLRANPEMSLQEVRSVAQGYLGQATALKFIKYVEMAKKVKIDELFEKPELVKQFSDARELSVVYAIVTGAVEKWRTATSTQKEKIVKPLIQISGYLREELCVFMLKQVKQVDMKAFKAKLVPHELFGTVVLKRVGKYFDMEGTA